MNRRLHPRALRPSSAFADSLALSALTLLVAASAVGAEPKHFDPKGKPPSPFIVEQQRMLRQSLPFADKADFEDARRGIVKAPVAREIRAADGKTAWSMGSYDWLLEEGQSFDSIHPSLQRQAVLNMAYGLYEVVPGRIWQVRGFDLANFTFVKGETGWIVFDVGTASETSRAALDLVDEALGKRPIVAVVYSHSHMDHFGGVRGMVDDADVRAGKVQIIAPEHFMEHAVAENVHAGPAMLRRMHYQYGRLLPRNPFGHVDQAIGKNTACCTASLIAPTRSISQPFEKLTVDGIEIEFQNTPGTEAPAEMNAWFPQFKAFWAAENVTGTIHNIYTLRGALVRDALEWSRQINVTLYRYGRDAEVMFASHSWPRFGNARIQDVLRAQRDTYAHLHNDVLNKANQGVTINEIHNVYKVPASLQQNWAAHSYHGSEAHNSRAIINRYLGYWDGNPAALTPLSPADSAPEYVRMMGGSAKIMARSRQLVQEGKYLLATELLNKLVYAEPGNQAAKDLLADAFEQLGYQKESPSLRNSFLAAAMELRNGAGAASSVYLGNTEDIARAVPTGMLLEGLAIAFDSAKAEQAGLKFVMNLEVPDTGEKFVVEVSNSTMTSIEGYTREDADATLVIPRMALLGFLGRKVTLEQLIAGGKATIKGNPAPLQALTTVVDVFPGTFQIMPGTVTP